MPVALVPMSAPTSVAVLSRAAPAVLRTSGFRRRGRCCATEFADLSLEEEMSDTHADDDPMSNFPLVISVESKF